ncbi:unnamed protein product [Brachionus calyciflorus]|uniref:Uncharacterized protein n=1 Tax=Brachionus calyciflorus TaxID=104777 RepID=A0A814L5U0_9BILA|nr:unnamed protein product [Brachionus calyciflorus]
MDISLDEINPSSLVDFTHRGMDESLSLQDSNIIDEIAQSLYRVAESHIEPLPNLSELTQQLNNNRLASNNRNNSIPNNETDTNATSQEQPNENNQFIDLTKEQDDILIISDSPRENRSTRRTIRKATIRPPQRSQLNELNDEIVISTQRRTRRAADNPNETIILDDDR